jgi:hypothetical protein
VWPQLWSQLWPQRDSVATMARDALVKLRVSSAERERLYAAAGGTRAFSDWARAVLLRESERSPTSGDPPSVDPPAAAAVVQVRRPRAARKPPKPAVPEQSPEPPPIMPVPPKARRVKEPTKRTKMCPHRVGPDHFCRRCDGAALRA